MADKVMALFYLGLFLYVGCFYQIVDSAVVQEVHVVPSQGQGQGQQHPYHSHTGHYPHAYHGGYPQETLAYTVPGQQSVSDPQYPGAGAQGGFPSNTYPPQAVESRPQSAGQLTPGQNHPGPPVGTPNQSAAQTPAAPFSHHGAAPAYPDPGDPTQAQNGYPGAAHAGYPQAQPQPAYPPQHLGAQYPYHHPVPQYPGQYPPQHYHGQQLGGYPNLPQVPSFSDPNSASQSSAGAAQPALVGAQSQNPDTALGSGDPQAAASAASGAQQGVDPQQQSSIPAPPPQSFPATAGGGQAPGNVNSMSGPYAGNSANAAGVAGASQVADPSLKPPGVAALQSPEFPVGNALPTHAAAFPGQPADMMQYKYPETKKPSFPPTLGPADGQPKSIVGSQQGFPPAQGNPSITPVNAAAVHPVNAAAAHTAAAAHNAAAAYNVVAAHNAAVAHYHHPHAAAPQQYPPVSYPSQTHRAPTVSQPYAHRGYPYPGQYPAAASMPQYHGGHAPYPGQPGSPRLGPHGRPYHGAAPPTFPQQRSHFSPSHPQRYPNNVPAQRPTTTTMLPSTTEAATPFPPELICYGQHECELGCCYAADGSILWDHTEHYGKKGYCYIKTTTIPGEGCMPGICGCQTDQICISVPSENATLPNVGEMAEGFAIAGNPKCYTSDQEIQIRQWLHKLHTIVVTCRLDPNCPLAMPVMH